MQPSLDALDPGVKIGRYTLIERVGAGATGVVFSAWDTELDRRVALKLVQSDGYGTEGTQALLGEAKALAKLSHPNVVTVFDVGTHGDTLFIAMEYLRGKTLARWREDNPDAPWSEVVERYMHAGAGLAAAHEAGLVHRDFKPANVIVTEGGTVKVLDFGLAQAEDATVGSAPAGTPRYMAPEQHTGNPVGAYSDQFSFSVALYEALYRSHPFGGDTALQISARVQRGDRTPAPLRPPVPLEIRDALEQGLAKDPKDRFGSMEAYIRALDPLASKRRRQRLVLAGVGVVVVGAALWAASTAPAPCDDAAAPLRVLWNEHVRADMRARLVAHEVPQALVGEALARLDAFSDGWAGQRVSACEDAKVRNTMSESALELRYHCLDQRLDQVSVLLEQLGSEDAAAMLAIASVLEQIPALDRCADLEALRASYPPPETPEARAKVRDLERRLQENGVLRLLGPMEAHANLLAVLEEADAVAYPPVQVGARTALGSSLVFMGKRTEGIAVLQDAVDLGLEHEARAATARALLELARAHGVGLRETEHATFLVRLAGALAEDLADDLLYTSAVHRALMDIHQAAGNDKGAVAEGRAWVETLEEAGVEDEPLGVEARTRLAFALSLIEQHEKASAMLDAVIQDSTIGDDHPFIARAYTYRARIHSAEERFEASVADHLEAYARYRKLYGEHHKNTAGRLLDAGRTLADANRLDEARTYIRRGLDALVSAVEAPDPSMMTGYSNLASIEINLGNLDAAQHALEDADRWAVGLPVAANGRANWRTRARGRIAEARGDTAAARLHFGQAQKSARSDEHRLASEVGLALADIHDGKLSAGQAVLLDAIDHPASNPFIRARAAWGLAMIEAQRGQVANARRYIAQARTLLEGEHADARMLHRTLDALEETLPPASQGREQDQ